MEEYIDILNAHGESLNYSASRTEVHAKGLWHRTVHIWVFDLNGNILFQKRSLKKENHPGLLATSIGTDVASSQLEKADLRVGLFMPNRIHMTRIPVAPGVHNLDIAALDSRGSTVSRFTFKQVSVQKGQKLFLFIPAIK